MEKRCYTIPEAQAEGAGGKSSIYRAINSGKLRAKKLGKKTVILSEDLDEYLKNLPDFGAEEAA